MVKEGDIVYFKSCSSLGAILSEGIGSLYTVSGSKYTVKDRNGGYVKVYSGSGTPYKHDVIRPATKLELALFEES